jgi:hypothetical protein
MTQSFWESETVGDEQPESELQPEVEETPLQPSAEPDEQQETLALSTDDFSELEERILRAVELVKRERMARADAEQRAAQAETQLREQAPLVDQLQTEVKALRQERDHVKQRIDRLLTQLDALEL